MTARAIALAGLLAACLAGHQAASGATLRSVQSGTATLSSPSVTVAITAVDMSRSFLVFSPGSDDKAPQKSQISGQITSPTELTFARWGGGAALPIAWYVAEFANGVSVRRGTAFFSDGDPCTIPCTPPATRTETLAPAVDVGRSFPLVSYHCDGSAFDNNDLLRARIVSDSALELSMTDSIENGVVHWQVVEYFDSVVQQGSVALAPADSDVVAITAPVDVTKSWLVYSYLSATGSVSDIGQKLVRGRVTGPTSLTFDRTNVGQAIELDWYLVEFTDATRVQHGSEPFTPSEGQRDVSITMVDLAKSFAAGGYFTRGGRSSYSGDDNPGVGWFVLELTSPTNLRLRRFHTSGSTADLGWFVVEFRERRVMQLTQAHPMPHFGR